MNFKKITAAIASVAAAATLAVSASAGSGVLVVVDDPAPNLTSSTSMWMVKVYVPQEEIDFGIDPREIGKAVFTVTPTEPEDFEGQIGGGLIFSSGPQLNGEADHNWPSKEYWGVYDEKHEIYGREEVDTKPVSIENTDTDYVYTLTLPVDDTNNIQPSAYASSSAYAQIAIQEWGNEVFSELEVLGLDLYDKSGALMGSFDGKGNFKAAGASAPATETPSDTASETASDTQAAADESKDAPAPTTGDTTAATTSSKGSPDTGVADVAAVAGIAVVAAGAFIVSRRRK